MVNIQEFLDRGISLKNEGHYEEAQACFTAVLECEPNNVEAHRHLGLVYGFIGLFDESIDELKTAVNLDQKNLKARNDLALTYSMLGMCDEAKCEFMTVLSADPENEVAKNNIIYFV
jgi:tetratricopeptide (TPR) repeat protein